MQLEEGAILTGKVTGITKFGVFVDIGEGKTGMVHISEVAQTYVENINDFVKNGDEVKVKVLSIGQDGKIGLSIKRAQEQKKPYQRPSVPAPDRPTAREWNTRRNENMSFEDMMSRFKQSSDDKFSDLKRKNGGEMRRTVKRGQK
jgi:S1 RNA binding domain protein